MVYSRSTWHCSECHKTHFSYEEARDCEGQHIVDRAVEGFRQKLAEILPASKVKAHLLASQTSGEGDRG